LEPEISIKLTMKSLKYLKNKIRRKELLSKHTSFRIGGKVDFWFEPADIEELRYILEFSHKKKLPLFVMGEGSNILVCGGRIKAVVIRLNKLNFIEVDNNQKTITAAAGVRLSSLVNSSAENNFTGLEFLFGIPGSLAGALVMNAGVSRPQKKWIDSCVLDICVMDSLGRIKFLDRHEAGFSYRQSKLDKFIILFATLQLKRSSKIKINRQLSVYKKIRKNNTPNYPNAGCIFKNPRKNLSAAKLIDGCGLKNVSVEGAVVWNRHANFIINRNKATYSDIIKLMHKIIKRVRSRYKITLIPEIKIWKS